MVSFFPTYCILFNGVILRKKLTVFAFFCIGILTKILTYKTSKEILSCGETETLKPCS